jgi:hypothetical protein
MIDKKRKYWYLKSPSWWMAVAMDVLMLILIIIKLYEKS